MANWGSVSLLGDPRSPDWQNQNLQWITMPNGQRWQVYKPAAAAFQGLLGDLAAEGYPVTSSGGYNYRNIAGTNKLSQHAFGTAIDINELANARGTAGNLPADTAQLAKKWGLEWGGGWKNPDPMHFEYTGQAGTTSAAPQQGVPTPPSDPNQRFIWNHWADAVRISQQTGIDPRIILAQSALETGYGKSAPGNNYFGIKGGTGAPSQTLEFVNGRMQPVSASFQSYGSPEESFTGYGNFMMGDRYAAMRGAKGLEAQAAELGKSGYATDPDYAKKVLSIAQGIPEGGYPSAGTIGQPETGLPKGVQGPPNPPGWGEMPKPMDKPDYLAGLRDRMGSIGGNLAGAMTGTGSTGNQPPAVGGMPPGAARTDAVLQATIDPNAEAIKQQRMQLALQRLNSGQIWG